jgi:4-hydroxy-tetrahydrodipicolinate reductase
MKLILIGTGRMGRAVEALAHEQGHDIVARFDRTHPLPDTLDALLEADVAVDFSLPDCVLGHIERCCMWGLPLVVGTTGWHEHLPRVARWVDQGGGAVLHAANFSVGVSLVRLALQGLMPLLDRLPEYDAFIHEVHHTGKVDSPSGTARLLAGVLLDGLSRKTHLAAETQHQRIDPAALHVTSTRAGHVVGTHRITLDSPFDQIELSHQAKGRDGFAAGALYAATWLKGRQGLFTLDDMLQDWLGEPAGRHQLTLTSL